VTYQGRANATLASVPTPQSQATSSSGAPPPEGIHPDAGREDVASLSTAGGATKAQAALSDRIFHGEVSSGTCAGCHGSDARGGPVGADLTTGTWLWSDGSLPGLTKTIAEVVPTPNSMGCDAADGRISFVCLRLKSGVGLRLGDWSPASNWR
jgi:hypothetical protein